MFRSFISFCVILGTVNSEAVKVTNKLCKSFENGAKIDAITYVKPSKMWFFTSSGKYWYLKETEFPPKEEGKPLPGGFKRGDAAYFINTLEACKESEKGHREQEIRLIEFVDGVNKVAVLDIRSLDRGWKEPVNYDKFKELGQLNLKWTQPIEGIFIHQKTNIFAVQNNKYSVLNFKELCNNPADPNGAKSLSNPPNNMTDLHINGAVDSISDMDSNVLHVFVNRDYWKLTVLVNMLGSNGGLAVSKSHSYDIITEFFHFPGDCLIEDSNPNKEPDPKEPDPNQPKPNDGTEVPVNEAKPTDEESGFPWIIVVIVIIIIVLIVIVVIVCLAINKKKGEAANDGGAEVAAGASSTASKTGTSPSGTGNSPKTGSKVGGKSPKSGRLGNSPSAMSVRSNTGVSKTGKN